MKRKNSFITNSSSTSYILHTEISGKIIPKQTDDDLTELFKDVTRSFPSNDDLKLTCTISDASAHNYVGAKFEIIDDEDRYREFSFEINLRYATDYEDKPREVIYVYIQSDYGTTEQSKELSFLHDVLIDLLERIVIYSSNRRNKFVYVKIPMDMNSGGWDGGDAMGFYRETMDCLKSELEIGTISITSGSNPIIKRKSLIKK